MAHNDPIIEKIRAADPARGVDLQEASRTPSARRMLDDIIDGDETRGRSGARLSRRGFVTMVAAATIVLSAVGAVATGLFSPDPQDVEGILDSAADAVDVHLPGWRPALNSEAVWCVYEDGHSASTYASEFPLDQPLTVERLVVECETGNDAARMFGAPESLTVCGAVRTDPSIREQLESGAILSGDINDRPTFPVVLGWDADCTTTSIDSQLPLELRDFTGVDAINRSREVEVRLEALALEECLSHDEAVQLADETAAELNDGWFVFEPSSRDANASCFRVDLDPTLGAVVIWGADPPSS